MLQMHRNKLFCAQAQAILHIGPVYSCALIKAQSILPILHHNPPPAPFSSVFNDQTG